MPRKPKIDKVKQLINLGKEKGFLTYDEVNDVLPAEVVSPDQIDELMGMFGEMDIEIVDESQKLKISEKEVPKNNRNGHTEENETEERFSLQSEYYGVSADPVRLYLSEMGSHSLLTREEEVKISKRIEKGKQAMTDVVLGTPLARREIYAFSDKLSNKKISIRDLVSVLEEDTGEFDEEKLIEDCLDLIAKMRDADEQIRELRDTIPSLKGDRRKIKGPVSPSLQFP